MGVGSGEAAQLMISEESTYGTYVAVTRSYEMVSETLKRKIERLESKGLAAGRRVIRSSRWVPGKDSSGGDINLELNSIGQGLLFKHMLGANVTSGSSPVYTHTATPGDLPTSLSVQVGRPSIDGTVNPFSYTGCRIHQWELGCKAGEIAMIKLSIAAQAETTAQALGTFDATKIGVPLTFVGGTLSLGGSQVDVLDATLKGNNSLDVGRFRLRGAATPKQPLENSWRDYTGSITADFESLTQYNHYSAGDELALSLVFVGAAIPSGGGSKYQLTITQNVRYDGETPNVSGPQMLTQPLPVKAVASGADSTAVTFAYQTTDSAA